MTSEEIRTRFLEFFKKRGHAIIPSASLVPENDPSVLFNTAGMQPLVPYLLGEKHPAGTGSLMFKNVFELATSMKLATTPT
jgi:alanyl-tRNA synthetase